MLAHTRAGAGEPLILVHGIAHRRQGWDPVLPLLAEHRDVIAIDLPGHGGSDDLPGGFAGGPEPLVDAVEAFAAELGLERPHVAGNSLGGLIALELAARGVARSATALSPAGFWSTPGRLWARGVLAGASALFERIPRARLEKLLGRSPSREALLALIMAHPSAVAAPELAEQLTGLADPKDSFHVMLGALRSWDPPRPSAVPTTVGWGTRDLLLPRRQAARVRALLPEAHVYLLPGCGHVPMADDPGLVTDLLLAGSRPRTGSGAGASGSDPGSGTGSDPGSGAPVATPVATPEPGDAGRPARRAVSSPRMRRPQG